LEITFRLAVFLFNPNTSELNNYFRSTQNSEEPIFKTRNGGLLKLWSGTYYEPVM